MSTRLHNDLPASSQLWELFSYDPLRGVLFNRLPRGSRAPIGSVAGGVDKHSGYTVIQIRGVRYYAHRLIYKWVTGHDPEDVVDHVGQEGIKPKYNAFHALESVSLRENLCRGFSRSRRHCLPTGVHRSGPYYIARATLRGRRLVLGTYYSATDAHAAYRAAIDLLSLDPTWQPSREFICSHRGRLKSSIHKGVSLRRSDGKWMAQVADKLTKKTKYLGLFSQEEEAASAVRSYDINNQP